MIGCSLCASGSTPAPWADGQGAKIAWKGETHFVLLDTAERQIAADGVTGTASALVLKTRDGQAAELVLPAGGQARCRGLQAQFGRELAGLRKAKFPRN
jgi:hypothetical protein